MILVKMKAISPDFKWLGFQIPYFGGLKDQIGH